MRDVDGAVGNRRRSLAAIGVSRPEFGAVGFADYLGFYWNTVTPLEHSLVAAAVCIGVTVLLYRDITSVGRLAVVMLVVVLATLGWVIVAGLLSFSWEQAFAFPPAARLVPRCG